MVYLLVGLGVSGGSVEVWMAVTSLDNMILGELVLGVGVFMEISLYRVDALLLFFFLVLVGCWMGMMNGMVTLLHLAYCHHRPGGARAGAGLVPTLIALFRKGSEGGMWLTL